MVDYLDELIKTLCLKVTQETEGCDEKICHTLESFSDHDFEELSVLVNHRDEKWREALVLSLWNIQHPSAIKIIQSVLLLHINNDDIIDACINAMYVNSYKSSDFCDSYNTIVKDMINKVLKSNMSKYDPDFYKQVKEKLYV